MLTRKKSQKAWFLLLLPLTISGLTHLWNPTGFPDIFFDEGVYMRRAMNVIEGQSPQEAYLYDHPYFGQIFLASSLYLVGYPDSLRPTETAASIESLYSVPRLLMGAIAVVDTYLIYCISRIRYGNNTAFVASLLFAVMPITWITRRILLDSLLLPFLLLSVFLALKTQDSKNSLSLSMLSGVCLGLAIFTKVPVLVVIPIIAYLIYSGSNKSRRNILVWLVPVLAIPLIWPAYSIYLDQFELGLADVIWQTQRGGPGILQMIKPLFEIDPVTIVISFAGIGYSVFRKDKLITWWFIPFFVFLYFIGFVQYFHIIPVLPVMLISAALLINDGTGFVTRRFAEARHKMLIHQAIIFSISVFGITSTLMIITVDVTQSQFDMAEYVLDKTRKDQNVTVLVSPVYSWILDDIYNRDNVLQDYSMIMYYPLETKDVLLVADRHFMLDIQRGKELDKIYKDTKTDKLFQNNLSRFDTSVYPFTSMDYSREGSKIEVRTNYDLG